MPSSVHDRQSTKEAFDDQDDMYLIVWMADRLVSIYEVAGCCVLQIKVCERIWIWDGRPRRQGYRLLLIPNLSKNAWRSSGKAPQSGIEPGEEARDEDCAA